MSVPLPDLEDELDVRLEKMGFELVDVQWVGRSSRPILRVKMDLPDSVPGQGGVSVDQCAEVSRAIEPWLDAHPGIPERYVLEVSSPGVDRPLKKPRDWSRFVGERVVVKGKALSAGSGNRLEGEIRGVVDEEGERPAAVVLLPGGEEATVPLADIDQAHLVFRWE